jgi:DNA-binding MarR family transcriptional regulator
VHNTPDDVELGRLLALLLRLVSPAAGEGAARDGAVRDGAVRGGAVQGGGPGRNGAAGDATAHDGADHGGAAYHGAAQDSAIQDGAAQDGAIQDGAIQDGAIQDGAIQDGAAQDGATRDGGTRDSAPAAGIPQVSGSEARALIELVKARGIAQGELAGLLGLEKSTVSRLAAGLERKGWVRRGRDEGNQRYVRLYLTAEGAAVAARLWDAWQSRQARILAALTEEERAGLSAGLRGLVRGLAAEGLLGEVPAG